MRVTNEIKQIDNEIALDIEQPIGGRTRAGAFGKGTAWAVRRWRR